MTTPTIFNDYVQLAVRTESKVSDCNNLSFRLLHMAIGLSTEIMELNEAFYKFKYGLIQQLDYTNIQEETADCFWYSAIGCDELELDFATILNETDLHGLEFNPEKYANDCEVLICKILDKVKRHIFYRKELELSEIKLLLTNLIQNLYKLAESTGYETAVILYRNIEKLKARYPDKYSDYNAVNRDLDREREILESWVAE